MTGSIESYFRLSAEQFFRALQNNPRCLMNVKGAVAEEHLAVLLDSLHDRRVIDGYHRGGEGKPDFFVNYNGRTVILECKMVQKPKNPPKRASTIVRDTIDFKKTRTQNLGKHLRFYRPDEFDAIGACLFNLTETWEFVFAKTSTFAAHPLGSENPLYSDRLSDKQVVMVGGQLLPNWFTEIESLFKAL